MRRQPFLPKLKKNVKKAHQTLLVRRYVGPGYTHTFVYGMIYKLVMRENTLVAII